MEKFKMSLANVPGKLSRAEMKHIMAGTSTVNGIEGANCTVACKNGGADTGTSCEKKDPCSDKGGRVDGLDCFCN